MRKIPLLFAIMLLACACSDERFIKPFISASDEIRLVQMGKEVFVYDPAYCQMSFNREQGIFRVHTDNMSDFYTVSLSRIPTDVEEEVTGTLVWTTENEVNARKNVSFSVEKIEGDKIWLWTSNGKIGAVIRLLD